MLVLLCDSLNLIAWVTSNKTE